MTAPYVMSDVTAPSTLGPPVPHVGRLSLTWAGLPRLGIAGPRADKEAQAPVSGFACASREVEAHGERGICERAMVLDCVHLDLMPAYAQVPLIAPGCCHSADPMTENGPISSDCARWICTVATRPSQAAHRVLTRALLQAPDGKKATPWHTKHEPQQHDMSFNQKIKPQFRLPCRRGDAHAHGYACPRKPSLVRCITSYNV